ncbi:MAG: hypothetical protein IJH52_02940 [Oscillospiraceae bacterium]|nr:hypothetical protein [Oscillospiraceae bacterium]
MDEKRKEIEKQYQKRTRPLLLLTLPLDLIALVLVAYGARVYREGGSPLMQFAGFLLMIAIGATLAIVLRRAARLRQEALDALEREYAANPDADEERIHIPGEAGTTSLLVMGYPSDTIYQLISGPGEYHFVKLGWGGLNAASYEKMIPPGLDDAAIRARMEKGLSVPKSEVEGIDLTMKHCVSTQLPNDGIFTLRSGGKKRKFIVLRPDEPATPEAMRAFFADVSGRLTVDAARYEKAAALRAEIRELNDDPETAPDPEKAKKLRPLAIALCIVPWLSYAVWRFLDVPYRPMAALQILLALLPVVLTLALPRVCSVNEAVKLRNDDPDARPGTVDMTSPILFSAAPLALGTFADFNFLDSWRLLIPAIVFGMLLALLVTRNGRGVRRIWLARVLLALMFSALGIGLIGETNFLLDGSEPVAERLAISDMYVSSGNYSSYVLEFERGGETLSLDVEPQLYDRVEPGDTVYVVTNHGAFGIEYATVWTVDEWNYRY